MISYFGNTQFKKSNNYYSKKLEIVIFYTLEKLKEKNTEKLERKNP